MATTRKGFGPAAVWLKSRVLPTPGSTEESCDSMSHRVLCYRTHERHARGCDERESKFPPSKRESRAAFIKRLKRTIMRTPSATLEPLVKSMKRRCAALKSAKGADFEE